MAAAQYRDPPYRAGGSAVALTVLLLGVLAGCVSPPRPAAPPSATAQCLGQLSAQGVRFEPVAQMVAANGCGIDNAVRVEHSAIAWNRTAEMSCSLATRLDSFEREVVQPAAQRYFGRPVVLIRHYGAYGPMTAAARATDADG